MSGIEVIVAIVIAVGLAGIFQAMQWKAIQRRWSHEHAAVPA